MRFNLKKALNHRFFPQSLWILAAFVALIVYLIPSNTRLLLIRLLAALFLIGICFGVLWFLRFLFELAKENVVHENPNATWGHALLRYSRYLITLAVALTVYYGGSWLLGEFDLRIYDWGTEGGGLDVLLFYTAVGTAIGFHWLVKKLNRPIAGDKRSPGDADSK